MTLADEPLEGRLFFGGVSGLVSISAKTDDEGHYSAIVPERKKWSVDVTASDPRVFRRFGRIDIEPPVGGVSELDIELPDTLIEVTTVDETGEPIAAAQVLIISAPATAKPAYLKTDEEGEVSFRGNDFGTYRLEAHVTAEGRQLRSPSQELQVVEESPSAKARLVLRTMKQLRGTILSAGGPVQGAKIQVSYPRSADSGPMLIPPIRPDGGGGLTLDVPSGIDQVDLVIMATGFILEHRRLAVETDTNIDILLDRGGGGVLKVNLTNPLDVTEFGDRLADVFYEDIQFDLRELQRWAVLNGIPQKGTALEIPLLPGGRYKPCRPVGGDNGSERQCEDGFLPVQGELIFNQSKHT